ncbi:hypothetical protein [Streptococcus phage Dp-1]|uniref:hypothetical protein n=1 Tax=Pneumococcus phage Dp-1 TaxID=59241 RepID=UPI0001F3E62E|nr:hypothetical protein StPhDp-1_gp29 [Streptococcus phage Dp-1]ADT64036.1 hypothetical protein [Streptococcus phage Dp-1]
MKTVKEAIKQFGDEWWYEIINENGQMIQDGRIEDMGEYMEETVDQVKFINYGDIESQIIKLYIA